MKKFRELGLNIIIFSIGNISVKLVQFLVMPLLTIYLTFEEYGLSDTLLSLTDLLVPIITLGLGDSIFRFSIEKSNKEEEILSGSIFVNAIMFIILSMIVIIVYQFFRESYIFLIIPLVISFGLKSMISAFVRGRDKSLAFSIGSIIQALLLVLFTYIFLIKLDMGFIGYILAMIASNIIAIIYLLFYSHPFKNIKLSKVNKIMIKKMLIFSLPAIPNMVAWWIVQTTNRYLAIYFVGMATASLYMAASKLPSLVNTFSTIFLNAWSLSSAKEANEEDRNDYYQKVFDVYKLLVIFGTAFTITISPLISKVLMQGEFYDGWVYSPLLILAAGLGCFSSFYGSFFGAFYKNKRAMISTVIGSVVNIIFGVLLMYWIGLWGAAIATVISYLVIVISRIIFCRDLIKINTRAISLILSLIIVLTQTLIFSIFIKDLVSNIIVSIVVFILVLIINISSIKDILGNLHKEDSKERSDF